MVRYIIRRLIYSIPVLVIASILVFIVMRKAADPTAALRLNPRISAADVARLRHVLGLDQSGVGQYLTWAKNFVLGNWGISVVSQRSVFDQIRTALVNSAILGIVAISFSLVIGVAIGVYSSLKQYSKLDNTFTTAAFVGISMPNFWFALLLQLLFGVYLVKWFNLKQPPFAVAGMTTPGSEGFHLVDRIRHIVLPATVLAVQIIAVYSRYMRASMLEVLHSDFLRTARAKGLRERRVVFRHAMRNALIPITTQLALDVGAIAAGLIITEQIFQWPGMGPLFINAVDTGDFPLALAWVMVTVFAVIIFNLVADIMYAVLDPRIRYA
jgi:ABC-type dipeptide/oligopeptide/nickel transport system permease component